MGDGIVDVYEWELELVQLKITISTVPHPSTNRVFVQGVVHHTVWQREFVGICLLQKFFTSGELEEQSNNQNYRHRANILSGKQIKNVDRRTKSKSGTQNDVVCTPEKCGMFKRSISLRHLLKQRPFCRFAV